MDEIYEALALEDIRPGRRHAAPGVRRDRRGRRLCQPGSQPTLAHDTEGTIAEARRLCRAGPAQRDDQGAGHTGRHPGHRDAHRRGDQRQRTLIFSFAHYEAVAEAYIAGLEKLAAMEAIAGRVASVASFFVSRVDTAVDRALEAVGEGELQGKIAIANAKVAYARFQELFSGERWERLAAQGARVQRPLWASTSTKNPRYPDTLYVDGLIGPDTVNTVPPATLDAFLDHGTVAPTLESGL